MEFFWYRESSDGEIELLRMFGTSPVVSVPERINDRPVTAIGEYCFSEKCKYTGQEDFLEIAAIERETERLPEIAVIERETERLPEIAVIERETERLPEIAVMKKEYRDFSDLLEKGKICELAGEMIQSVSLPKTVRLLGSLVFYRCKNLTELHIWGESLSLGSDVFMNCSRLEKIHYHTLPEKTRGLKQILAQRNHETVVYWTGQAAVLFPEYTEGYEVIGPAHIFELNIEGEGFRARQCFADGIFQFDAYDQIFEQACHLEEPTILCRMAMLRLGYPWHLSRESKERYQTYLREKQEVFCEEIIQQKALELAKLFVGQGEDGRRILETCIQKSTQAKWIQGTRTFLSWKKEYQEEREDRYAFEDF